MKILSVLFFVVFSCSSGMYSDSVGSNQQVPVTGISLDSSSLLMNVLDSMSLVATIIPNNATNKVVTWTSSNSSIASVDNNGTIAAKAYGTVDITATSTDGNYSAKCTVTVTSASSGKVSVTNITLDLSTMLINVNESKTLTATVIPDNATNKNITWISANSLIASVDNNGTVTGISPGSVDITATSVDGNLSVRCYLTVNSNQMN